MESIDKNDVDVTKLFGWRGKVTIIDDKEKPIMDVYVRLAGDADINRARVSALRESMKLRQSLRDIENLDRLAYITPKELVGDKKNLVEILTSIKTRDLTREAINNVKLNIPAEPDDNASLEEQEEYQKKIDEWPKEREKAIRKYILKKTIEVQREFEEQSFDELYTQYENQIIDITSEFKMLERFRDMSIYLNCFKDENYKQKLFTEFDEYDNLPTNIKTQLREYYLSLEVGTDELKK